MFSVIGSPTAAASPASSAAVTPVQSPGLPVSSPTSRGQLAPTFIEATVAAMHQANVAAAYAAATVLNAGRDARACPDCSGVRIKY